MTLCTGRVLSSAFDRDVAAFGDYDVDFHVVGFGVNVVVNQLEVVSYTYFHGMSLGEQTVVIAFAAADAVAVTVVCYAGHNHQLYLVDVGHVVAGRLLYVECTDMQSGAVVREDVEIDAIDSRQVKLFARVPPVEECTCRQFVRKRMVNQNLVGEHECGGAFKLCEYSVGGLECLTVGKYAFARLYPAPDILFFHLIWY